MKIKIKTILTLPFMLIPTAMAANYPFDLPETISAEIKINTLEQEKYNNKLLGTNISNFGTTTDKDMIRAFDPLTIRFPHGLWANWYDWRNDTTRLFGDESFEYTRDNGAVITQKIHEITNFDIWARINATVGIEGLTELNTERKSNVGSGYDMMWTFNMSADGPDFTNGSPESIERYQDLLNRGFEVLNIEMGNENFYPGQRSSIIPNVSDYISRAKSMSAALKAINPNIKVSIPLLRRASFPHPNYNKNLTADKTYFDAISIHTYVGSDPDNADNSDNAFSTALTARHHLAKSVDDFPKVVAPNKPIWLTEWGVKSGGPNAASILGMADAYIFMSENQDTYQRANWFSANGQLNSFLVWYQKEVQPGVFRPRVKYPLEKTAFGSTHEVLRSILQDSTLLSSEISTVELSNSVNAISARAVIKDDKVVIFAVNLTDKLAPFSIKLDNTSYAGDMSHHTMAFNSMDEERNLPFDAEPLTLVGESINAITLPPLSINKIILKEKNIVPEKFDIKVESASKTYSYELGNTVNLEAIVEVNSSQVESVQFFNNDNLLTTDNTPPYQVDWIPTNPGTYKITAKAVKKDGAEKTSEITLFTLNGEPLNINIGLTQPSKAVININESLLLSATATTNYGDIASVDFQVNGSSVFISTSAPFDYTWQPTVAGAYKIEAVATTTQGDLEKSNSFTVNVAEPEVPTVPETPVPEVPVPEVPVPETPEVPVPENPIEPEQPSKPSVEPDNGESSGGSINILLLSALGLMSIRRKF